VELAELGLPGLEDDGPWDDQLAWLESRLASQPGLVVSLQHRTRGVLGRCKARRVVEYRAAFADAETGQVAAATCISRWWHGYVCRNNDDIWSAAEVARDMRLEVEAMMAAEADDYPWDYPPCLDGSYAAQLVLLEAKLTAQGEEWQREARMTQQRRKKKKKKKKKKKEKQRAKEARVREDEGGRVGLYSCFKLYRVRRTAVPWRDDEDGFILSLEENTIA
jgi:hypothetical protein